MNLVAQEYVATRNDEDGVLILSPFAGAADRLAESMLVNPYDRSAMVTALDEAFRRPLAARRAALQAMRKPVMAEDEKGWLGWFLAAANLRTTGRKR